MRRDVPHPLKATPVTRLGGGRLATICVVAFFATGVWWLILHFGSRAAGYPIGGDALLLVLACIYLLLVLGLSMAAMAASSASDATRGASQESIAASARTRRKAG